MASVLQLTYSGICGWMKYQAKARPIVHANTIYWSALRAWRIASPVADVADPPTESQVQFLGPRLVSRDDSDALQTSMVAGPHRFLVADEVGLGKTVIARAITQRLRQGHRRLDGPVNSMFALERPHVDQTILDNRLPLRRRINRAKAFWTDYHLDRPPHLCTRCGRHCS